MINLRQNGTGQKLNIDTSPLYQHIHSLETNTSFLQHQIKSISSQTNNNNQYYDSSNKLTERPFNYNLTCGFVDNTTRTISASIYGSVPVSSYKNSFVDIKAGLISVCTFYRDYGGYSNLYADIFNKNSCKGDELILNGGMNNSNTYNIGFLLGNNPIFSLNLFSNCINLDFHDKYFDKNTILTNYKINNNGFKCRANSLSSVRFLNLNNCSVIKNSLKNVNYLNCIGEIFENNEYINQSDQQYQCQLMNVQISSNNFVYPDLLNVTCKNFATNTISNANFVDMKCDHLISNEIYNVRFLKIHNVESGGYGFYSGIGDFYLENFSTKSTNESISNVTKFRFNNGSSNLYDTNLNWTLTNSNYDLVESNIVHCGDFNPIPYIRSINQHLDSIETKLTQISPESDVFVKKINVSNLANNTTFSSADSLKINCLTVKNFNCSDIISLKINGSNLESGMFSNIKSVELNVNYCNELTFDNVEYIKVSCTNSPNIYCSNIGTVKLNNYNKIQLQKFNLFEAPHPNNYFYSCYMCNWNSNPPRSNPYDAHYMTDYTINSDSYATVKFKFNVDTFKQAFTDIIYIFENTITTQRITTNKLLFWTDNTFKLCNVVEYVNNTGFIETAPNVLTNYQMQFDMPYITTFTNYYN